VQAGGVFPHASFPSCTEDMPVHVAEGALDEGPRLLTTLGAVEHDALTLERPGEMVCDEVTDAGTLTQGRPRRRGCTPCTEALPMAPAAPVATGARG
jgi:hypothetical protein